jgi:hypothetical protein
MLGMTFTCMSKGWNIYINLFLCSYICFHMNIWHVPMGEQDVPKCGNMIKMILNDHNHYVGRRHSKTWKDNKMINVHIHANIMCHRKKMSRSHLGTWCSWHGNKCYNVGMLFLKNFKVPCRCHIRCHMSCPSHTNAM